MKIAVLGLGLMGVEIALRLCGQGFPVVGWNRSPGRAQAAAARGIDLADSAAAAVAAADLALLALGDGPAIRATLLEPPTADALAGRVLIQTGTIAPAQSREIAARVEALGGRYLEAPVLGSLPEVRAGRLIVMAGGDPELFSRCLPVLRALGGQPELIGEVGQAAALKLAMNQLIAALTAAFSLSLGLVRSQGIDPERFMALLRDSALYAKTFDKKLPNYLAHDYRSANFPLKHLLKDVRLFRQVAESAGQDTATLAALEGACLRAQAQGLGDLDYSALYEALNPPAGDPPAPGAGSGHRPGSP